VAAVIRALVDDPTTLPAGAVNVGPREPITVADAVRALLDGAGVSAPLGRHPDHAWRAPHGGADEALAGLAAITLDEAAAYYCVEPWMGPPNAPENKLGLHFVAPGKTEKFTVEVAVK
jgi:nucleoside-diphosphate-sugar epimerase